MVSNAGVILTCAGYLMGSFPTAVLIGKWRTGKDIRNNEYQNMGANNIYHSVGKFWGCITFLIDFLKGYIPTAFAWHLFSSDIIQGSWVLAAAGSTIIGHNWPVFAHFRGGKGASTATGISFASFPVLSFFLLPVLFIFNRFTKNISLSAGICFTFIPLFTYLNSYSSLEKHMSILIPLLFLPKIVPLLFKMIRESKHNPKKMWFIFVHGFKKAAEKSFEKSSTITKNTKDCIVKTSASVSKKTSSFTKKMFQRKGDKL